MNEERRMLPVQNCIEANGNGDCPHLFHESYLCGQKYCTCSKQGATVYVSGDIKDMPSARKELFKTCPLEKAGKVDNVIDATLSEVCAEIVRAETKHPCWPEDDFEALTILTEEVGEAAQAMLEEKYREAPHANVRKEMVQCAAMALRWLVYDAQAGEKEGGE